MELLGEESLPSVRQPATACSFIVVRSIERIGQAAITSSERRMSSVWLTPQEGEEPTPMTPTTSYLARW